MSNESPETSPVLKTGADNILAAVIAYFVTLLIVFNGVWFSMAFFERRQHPNINSPGLQSAFSAWDGVWYRRIVDEGYAFDSARSSSVAFFPLYPLLGSLVCVATQLPSGYSLLLVTHASLLATYGCFARYLTVRGLKPAEAVGAITALSLWPTTFFWRMTYTESLFTFLMMLVMLGFQLKWPTLTLTLLVGTATATRATGVALAIPLAYHVWMTYRDSTWKLVSRGVFYGCLSCWGLFVWMAYQYVQFGTPFAFMQTQAHWGMRDPLPIGERVLSLLIGEPLWSVYVPSSPAYWARFEPTNVPPLFSLQFANPIFVVISVTLVIVGARNRWLNTHEVLLSAGLLFIPYVTHSYQTVMMAQGRYASVVIPVYLVMGRLLARCPQLIITLACAVCACVLVTYSMLFAAWYRII